MCVCDQAERGAEGEWRFAVTNDRCRRETPSAVVAGRRICWATVSLRAGKAAEPFLPRPHLRTPAEHWGNRQHRSTGPAGLPAVAFLALVHILPIAVFVAVHEGLAGAGEAERGDWSVAALALGRGVLVAAVVATPAPFFAEERLQSRLPRRMRRRYRTFRCSEYSTSN